MVARTSASTRDRPTSPRHKSAKRASKSQSPVVRMTRATRSQSRDLDNDSDMQTRKGTRARGAREGTVETVDSIGSSPSHDGQGRRRRKNTRSAAAVARDLSIVAEEQEREQLAETELALATEGQKVSQSPGALSRLSGTTALTTQSVQKLDDLDVGMIVELLPDLSREAFRLFELLSPSQSTPDAIEAIVKELQVPGSGRGKRLRLRERTFDSTKENYTNELFIDPSLILQKLFNDQDPVPGNFSPDTILHAANCATLVKELLIAQRDNPNTMDLLQRLDDTFPSLFLSNFRDEPGLDISDLREATFDLALDLRTQTVIAVLKTYKDEENYEPNRLVAQLFYEMPDQQNESISTFENLISSKQFRKVAGIRAKNLSSDDGEQLDTYSTRLSQRVDSLRESFYTRVEAIAEGDFVDFDLLYDRFPWVQFLADISRWSQLRLKEISKAIALQGGVDNITRSLIEKIKSADSQIELYSEPPKVSQTAQALKTNAGLLPAANIIPASAGKSFYNSSRSLQAVLRKSVPSSSAPPSNQEHPSAPVRENKTIISAQPQKSNTQKSSPGDRTTAPESPTYLIHDQFDDNEDAISDSGASSIAEVLHIHDVGERYNFKENRPTDERDGKIARLRFVDRQANAERVRWSQQDEDGEPTSQRTGLAKRKRQIVEHDEDEDEDDEEDDEFPEFPAFVRDDRPVDHSRRKQAAVQVGPARSLVLPTQSSPKRARVGFHEESENEHLASAMSRREKRGYQGGEHQDVYGVSGEEELDEDALQEQALQASAREADDPTPSYAEVNETARAVSAAARRYQGPRKRKPWSEDETKLLEDLIGRLGCRWKTILMKGGDRFAASDRDQVALKDRARNMKVNYLLYGGELPLNFNFVALGKKERERVLAKGLNPYRLEGELVGHESYDMEGNPLD